jgi:quercetin dioxygenase-like cupin family protein
MNLPENLKGTPVSLLTHIAYADGAVVSKTMLDKGIGSITLFAFDKGQGIAEHTSPFDTVMYVIEGDAQIIVNAKPAIIKSGQMIIIPAGSPHSLHAVNRYKMLQIMIRAKGEKTTERAQQE